MADNQVKGFIVENKTTPGFSVEKIPNKFALKVVQNGLITLKDVRLPEANHLQSGMSFRDTANVLTDTLWRRHGWRRDARWALSNLLLSTRRSACSLEGLLAHFNLSRIFSRRCSLTSPHLSVWWLARHNWTTKGS